VPLPDWFWAEDDPTRPRPHTYVHVDVDVETYVGLTHDQIDGVIETGTGDILIDAPRDELPIVLAGSA